MQLPRPRFPSHLPASALRTSLRAATALGLLLAAVVTGGASVSVGSQAASANAAAIDARVNDLLHRMTLEEKVGQMDQIVIGKLKAPSPPANGDCNGGNNDPCSPSACSRS